MNKNSSSEQTPEQLLKMLDLQIAAQRAARERSGAGLGAQRLAWVLGGLVFLAAGLGLAWVVLERMVEARHGGEPAPALSGQ